MTSAKRTSFLLTVAVTAVFFCVATAYAGKPDNSGGGGRGGGGAAYNIIPFAPFGLTSTASNVADVNEMGTVAIGNANLPDGQSRSAHLNIASGVYTTFADHIYLKGINNHNQMVGAVGDDLNTAAFWDDLSADPVTLPPLAGHAISWASGINDAGIIIGASRVSEYGATTGVVWQVANGIVVNGPLPMPSLPGDVAAGAVKINELDGGVAKAVGDSHSDLSWEAVVWTIEIDDNDQLVAPAVPQRLGTLNLRDPSGSNGLGINNEGDTVGYSDQHPFLTVAGGSIEQLPLTRKAVYGKAWDVNDADEIVGSINLLPKGATGGLTFAHAALWKDGEPTLIESLIDRNSGWEHLTNAFDIAENGVIAGYGHYDVQTRGFLVIPNASSAASIASVPEPSTLALFVLSTFAVLPLRRKNRTYN